MPNLSVFYSNPCTLWINASPLSLETVGISLRNLVLSMTWGLSVSVFRRRDSRVEPWFPEALPRGLTYVSPNIWPLFPWFTLIYYLYVICIYKKVLWNSSIAMLFSISVWIKTMVNSLHGQPPTLPRAHRQPTGLHWANARSSKRPVRQRTTSPKQFPTWNLHWSASVFFPKKGGCLKSSYYNLLGKGILKMAVLMGKLMILGYIPYVHQDNERTSIK